MTLLRLTLLSSLAAGCSSASESNSESDSGTVSSTESGGQASSDSTADSGGETADEGGETGAGFLPTSDILSPDLGVVDSHDEDIQPIWSQRCVLYCHATGAEPAAADLDLHDGAHANIVSVASGQSPLMLIEPGAPEASYLWHKILDTHLDVDGEGDMMPPFGTPLSEEDLARIELWILDGAPP